MALEAWKEVRMGEREEISQMLNRDWLKTSGTGARKLKLGYETTITR